MKRLSCFLGALCIACFLTPQAHAAMGMGNCLFDESVDGLLSQDNLSPTDLGVLMPGLNRVSGLLEDAAGVGNVDVFMFQVPTGFVLDGVFVADYAYTVPPGDPNERNAFLGINDEESFPYDAAGLDINNNPFFDENLFLGGSIFGLSDLDDPGTPGIDETANILARIGNVTGRGFTGPLGEGTYTIYLQQTGPENSYSLDFSTSVIAVPEPAHLSLLAFATLAAVERRRRKRRAKQSSN